MTRPQFDTGLNHQGTVATQSIWTFSETKIHALEKHRGDDDGNVTYHAFDRSTGEQVAEVPLPIRNDEVNVGHLGWWRMAAKPE